MKDRFKFRAFLKEKKELLEVQYINLKTRYVMCDRENGTQAFASFDNVEIMQCTGKRDVSNRLIYEGDIISLLGNNGFKPIYVVKYIESRYKWVLIDNYSKYKGKVARDFYIEYTEPLKLYKEGYRVIGNIYENPEMLEAKND